MKILVACEESQAVTIELRKLGHEAYSCDIIDQSGGHPEWHIMRNALSLLNGRCTFSTTDGIQHSIEDRWDMLIAHPPCTYMSKAGACRMYPKAGQIDPVRFEKAMEAKSFFMKFLEADCKRIAVENPTPLKCIGLPKPSQVIQPYEFGDPFSKRTLLWLVGLPNLEPTEICKNYTPWMPSNTGGYSRGRGGARGFAKDQKTASRTFPGIAKAMAEQWAGQAKEVEPNASDN